MSDSNRRWSWLIPLAVTLLFIPLAWLVLFTALDDKSAYDRVQGMRYWIWAATAATALGILYLFFRLSRRSDVQGEVLNNQQLGQYHLESKIGEGGMGVVYRARHILLKRATAIKLLRADRDSSDSIRKFQREVRFTSRLTHPNTIAIYDYGYTPDKRFFYAMEYIQGVTLDQCVQETGAQPEARVVSIMRQICGSIAEAHTAGLIHRDIKPANIMLCERGGLFDFVKVLDFGLVRSYGPDQSQVMTNVQQLTGTPLYLSPEAIQSPELQDACSDVYQLGAIAYYLLTGEHLFSGDNIYEICNHHLYTEPEPPSSRLGKAVSPELQRLILSCLEKDREKRPENGYFLYQSFESCSYSGKWGQEDARSWWQAWIEDHEDWVLGRFSSPSNLSGSGRKDIVIDLDQR